MNEYLPTSPVLSAGGQQNNIADIKGALVASPTGKYTNITSATTAYVSTAPGVLQRIVVNTTAAGTIKIYDSLVGSGTLIGTLKASVAEHTFEYDTEFLTGLTIVTAAASDITVVTR